jgi:hypothetical protein
MGRHPDGFEGHDGHQPQGVGIDFNIRSRAARLMIGDKITVHLTSELVLQPQEALAV